MSTTFSGGFKPFTGKLKMRVAHPNIAPQWVTTAGSQGTLYSGDPQTVQLTATDRKGVTYSLLSGTLPPGMTLNTATGSLNGTPNVIGTYTFTIRAKDPTNLTSDRQFSLNIEAKPVPIVEDLMSIQWGNFDGTGPTGNYDVVSYKRIRRNSVNSGSAINQWASRAIPGGRYYWEFEVHSNNTSRYFGLMPVRDITQTSRNYTAQGTTGGIVLHHDGNMYVNGDQKEKIKTTTLATGDRISFAWDSTGLNGDKTQTGIKYWVAVNGVWKGGNGVTVTAADVAAGINPLNSSVNVTVFDPVMPVARLTTSGDEVSLHTAEADVLYRPTNFRNLGYPTGTTRFEVTPGTSLDPTLKVAQPGYAISGTTNHVVRASRIMPNTGRFYWEFSTDKLTSGSRFGLSVIGSSLNSVLGDNTHEFAFDPEYGRVYSNGQIIGSYPNDKTALNAAGTWGIAIDLSTSSNGAYLFIRKPGGQWVNGGNPTNITNYIMSPDPARNNWAFQRVIPAVMGTTLNNTQKWTIRSKTDELLYSVPSNFVALDDQYWTLGNLTVNSFATNYPGRVYTMTLPTSNKTGAQYTYQWLLDGTEVGQAASHTAQSPGALVARLTGSLNGETIVRETSPIAITPVGGLIHYDSFEQQRGWSRIYANETWLTGSNIAHTGGSVVMLGGNGSQAKIVRQNPNIQITPNKQYRVDLYYRTGSGTNNLAIAMRSGTTTVVNVSRPVTTTWNIYSVTFTATASTSLQIDLGITGGNAVYVDDLMITQLN